MNPYASNSKSFQKLNPHLFPPQNQHEGPLEHAPKRPKLNKTEQAYLEHLQTKGFDHIYTQDITLRLADDCRLTVDFVTVRFADNGWTVITAIDVKGFQREDALIKMKVAAKLFPWIGFKIVKRDKRGWEERYVNP